ncbi:DNA recombination and repair protein Rad51 C-terminal [Penicillium chermesinum]|nr:DNA recombination and repair protein Rad51 C-terminal [Penicillium chermesinum]
MDLLAVLPDFVIKPYAHILPPLERSKITVVDLITLDTLEIAKRAHVPPADVRRLAASVVDALHTDLGVEKTPIDPLEDEPSSSIDPRAVSTSFGPSTRLQPRWNTISTLDSTMDGLLGGGIPTGYVTEVTGESGSGKTQFLLNLLISVQLAKPHGLRKNAIYISTEHPLATSRLAQVLECHPYLSALPAGQAPSLQNILAINAMDLETQEHIFNYQLPVAIKRYNVGLVVVDSITSNYRAERTNSNISALSHRSTELAKLGHMLRNLAAKEDIAFVLANQVSDRFDPARDSGTASPRPRNRTEILEPATQSLQDEPPSSPASSQFPVPEDDQFDGTYLLGNAARNEAMSLLHQERFFTGWGDSPWSATSTLKTPALGFFWSTQIACRIALKREQTRIAIAPWGGRYPLSTPREQTDIGPQDTGNGTDPRPGFLLASESQTENTKAEPKPQVPIQSEEVPALPSPPITESQKHAVLSKSDYVTKRTMKVVFAPWHCRSDGVGQ